MRKKHKNNKKNFTKPSFKFSLGKISATKSLLAFFSIVFIFVVTLFVVKIVGFLNTVTVKQIQIVGASAVAKQNLQKDLTPLIGKPIVDIPVNDLKQEVLSRGWVRNASVHKNLNGKITISILEQNPYFVWLNNNNTYKIIDSKNQVVTKKLAFSLDKLIVIKEGQEALNNIEELRFLMYKDLDLLKQIKLLTFNGLNWVITLHNGVYIKLPENNLSNAYAKLLQFKKAYGFNAVTKYIDLSAVNKVLYR